MEPVSLATIFHAAKDFKTVAQLATLLSRIPRNPNKELESASEDMFQWWVSELAERAAEQASYLEKIGADVEAVKSILVAPEFQRVFCNYAFEAMREAIDERRRMLASAFIGSVEPTLTLADIARTERAIRELDPDDVIDLYSLSTVGDAPVRNDAHSRWQIWQGMRGADALVSAGCVRISTGGGGFGIGPREEAYVTRIGRNVLLILRAYILARQTPTQETPGRE